MSGASTIIGPTRSNRIVVSLLGTCAHLRVIQLGSGGSSSATASSTAASVSAGNGCDASHLWRSIAGMSTYSY